MIRNALGDSFPASPEVTLRLCREAGTDECSHVLHLGAGVGTVCQMLIEAFGCKATGVVVVEPLLQHCIYEDERVPEVFSDDVASNARVADEQDSFAVPEVDEKDKPSEDQIKANKEKWNLND